MEALLEEEVVNGVRLRDETRCFQLRDRFVCYGRRLGDLSQVSVDVRRGLGVKKRGWVTWNWERGMFEVVVVCGVWDWEGGSQVLVGFDF